MDTPSDCCSDGPTEVQAAPVPCCSQVAFEDGVKVSDTMKDDGLGITLVPEMRIKVHSKDCFPVPDNVHGFDLKVDLGSSEEAAIPPRMCFQFDCGWSVDMPKGYRLEVQTNANWTKKGLLVVPALYPLHDGFQRVKLHAFNLGKQILGPEQAEAVAKGWFSIAPQVALVTE